MSLSTRFLNLSMKEQICISIIVLTLFCILVILIVCCSLIYEILNKDYENKKAYFYKKYKQYIESAFYFQSFHMMQYEEILHRIQKQIWKVQQSSNIYTSLKPLQNYSDYIINMTNRKSYNFTELNEKRISRDTPYLYIISLINHELVQNEVRRFSLNHYQLFANSLFSCNIYDSFRIPGYGVPIMDQPLFFNLNFSTIFGFNYSKINQQLDYYYYLNPGLFNVTLPYVRNEFIASAKGLLKYISNKLEMFQQIFPKLYKEFSVNSQDIYYSDEIMDIFAKQFVGYLSKIEYGADTFSLLSSNESFNYYYTQMNTIPNLLFFLNQDFSRSLDIDFIPFYYPNMTLLSQDLCALFKNKQHFLSGKEFDFKEVYDSIHHKESSLENCFIDNNLINSQEEIKDIFDLFFDNFSEINNIIYQGVFEAIPNHSEFPFYFMKYSYPNYNTLREFQSEYLYSDQVNFYAFASFKKIQKYVEQIRQVNLNIFFFIIMVIVYSWLICLFINLCIFFKVIDDWTNPITKLQEAVESSSIKDESIFKYQYDDIINELFLTCKELLSGQINNSNDNGINNFNILGKDNEKKIDKNIYKKNLIINNDIMEELIDKQQSEMDFSNNVKLNEINSLNNSMFASKNKIDKKVEQSDENLTTNLDSNTKSQKEKIEKKDNKNEKKKEKESYIKLFKISEYLDYYRSKLDTNNMIILNEAFDETKASQLISKNNTKSINSSISNQKTNKNEESNENNYINMMDETNITYLWYMEAKRKTRSFNYNISNDCKELFTEYYDNNKSNSLIDNKKSFNLQQKEKNTDI